MFLSECAEVSLPPRSPKSPESQSGDDAPLHSLRGPSTGEMRLKSDKDTVLGRSRLQGREGGSGEDEEDEEEGVGDGDAEEDVYEEEEEEEEAKGQGDISSWGLLGVEPRLQVERVSESSSDMMLPPPPPPPHGSSSKHTDATAGERERELPWRIERHRLEKKETETERERLRDVVPGDTVALSAHAPPPGAHGGVSPPLVDLVGDHLQVPERRLVVGFGLRQFGLTLVHVLLQVLGKEEEEEEGYDEVRPAEEEEERKRLDQRGKHRVTQKRVAPTPSPWQPGRGGEGDNCFMRPVAAVYFAAVSLCSSSLFVLVCSASITCVTANQSSRSLCSAREMVSFAALSTSVALWKSCVAFWASS
ncbi:hypothetical protein INR49_020828 [Caranx melampygus]|nr:hypothetical protein INR49_020828 [Caranx melampygus]